MKFYSKCDTTSERYDGGREDRAGLHSLLFDFLPFGEDAGREICAGDLDRRFRLLYRRRSSTLKYIIGIIMNIIGVENTI